MSWKNQFAEGEPVFVKLKMKDELYWPMRIDSINRIGISCSYYNEAYSEFQ